jgi:hypothetical protein
METQPAGRPRRIFTPEQRAEIVKRYRQSGLKQREFAAQEGISLASLNNWLYSRRGLRFKRRTPKAKFQEVVLSGPSSGWALELISPRGWTVRVAQMPARMERLQVLLGGLAC